MVKSSFMKVLEQELSLLSILEREQILEEYYALFDIKEETGLSENEIILELGDPKEIAQQFLDELNIEKPSINQEQYTYGYKGTSKKNTPFFIGAIIFDVLIGFWIIFTILMFGFAFAMLAIGLFIAAIGVLIAVLSSAAIIGLGEIFILLGLSILFAIFSFWIFKISIKIIVRHINWLRGLI
ncbi:MAG: DUF1700 domain-containing protein [Erysipelotrichales bacterium]